MKEQVLPRVLVVDINPWREDGTSHTMKNIFTCWSPEKVAQIYTKPIMPYTKVASRFFQIDETVVIKSVLKPWLCAGGEVVSLENVVEKGGSETRRDSNTSGTRFSFMYLCREVLWLFGHWRSKKLDEFLKDYKPDLIFACIQPTVFSGWIERYIIRKTGKPFVCYLADDNYSYDSCSDIWSYIHRFWMRKNVKWLSTHCKEMFVIVEKEKEDTDKRFGTDSVILTKSIDFTEKDYKPHKPNIPLKFVYTGSMIIGRDKTLALVADAINKINKEAGSIKAELYIYSQSEPSDDILVRINNGASHFCGMIGRDEVQLVQKDADVVVFAEALVGKESNAAKLSFSTKITDYLSNGKCVLAIGKEEIAPIDYFKRNDSALIAYTETDVELRVREIVGNPQLTEQYGKKAYDCAVRNHDMDMMNKRFINTMLKVLQ
jgi:hypothetical protein